MPTTCLQMCVATSPCHHPIILAFTYCVCRAVCAAAAQFVEVLFEHDLTSVDSMRGMRSFEFEQLLAMPRHVATRLEDWIASYSVVTPDQEAKVGFKRSRFDF